MIKLTTSNIFNINKIPFAFHQPVQDNIFNYDFKEYLRFNITLKDDNGEYFNDRLSYIKYKTSIDELIKLRKEGFITTRPDNLINYTSIVPVEIPIDYRNKMINEVDNILNSYNQVTNINYNLYDRNFYKNLKIISVEEKNPLDTTNLPIKRSYRVLNANENVNLYLIIRGIRVPFRKVETTQNNYIFLYPEYLLKSYKDNYESSNRISIENLGSGRIYSNDTLFEEYKTTLPILEKSASLSIIRD